MIYMPPHETLSVIKLFTMTFFNAVYFGDGYLYETTAQVFTA